MALFSFWRFSLEHISLALERNEPEGRVFKASKFLLEGCFHLTFKFTLVQNNTKKRTSCLLPITSSVSDEGLQQQHWWEAYPVEEAGGNKQLERLKRQSPVTGCLKLRKPLDAHKLIGAPLWSECPEKTWDPSRVVPQYLTKEALRTVKLQGRTLLPWCCDLKLRQTLSTSLSFTRARAVAVFRVSSKRKFWEGRTTGWAEKL